MRSERLSSGGEKRDEGGGVDDVTGMGVSEVIGRRRRRGRVINQFSTLIT